MSVAFTEAAVRDRTKTVTRRKGWWEDKNGRRMVKPGDRLTLCRKVMGRKGAPLLRIAEVEVVHVQRHALSDLLTCDPQEAREEMALEGFPTVVPYEFVRRFFVEAQGMDVGDFVTRIEWRYLDAEAGEPA